MTTTQTKADRLQDEVDELRRVVAALTHDGDVIQELRNQVEALKREAHEAHEAARDVVKPIGMYGDAQATKREHDAHEAWKRKMGYGEQPSISVTLETGDEYQQAVTHALRAEAAQKEFLEQRARDNATHRAAAGVVEPDQFQRAQSSAARQRAVEAERLSRDAEDES